MLEKIQPQETLTSYQRTNLEKKGQGEKKKSCVCPVSIFIVLGDVFSKSYQTSHKTGKLKKIVMYLLGATDIFRMMLELPYRLVTYLTTENKTDSKNAIKSGLVKFFLCDSQQTHKNRQSLYLFYFKILSNFDIGIVNTVGILFYIKTARSKRNCRQFALPWLLQCKGFHKHDFYWDF